MLQSIVNELSVTQHHSPEDDSFEVNLKTAIMSFLNALINCGAGEVTVFRLSILWRFCAFAGLFYPRVFLVFDNRALGKWICSCCVDLYRFCVLHFASSLSVLNACLLAWFN